MVEVDEFIVEMQRYISREAKCELQFVKFSKFSSTKLPNFFMCLLNSCNFICFTFSKELKLILLNEKELVYHTYCLVLLTERRNSILLGID